MSIAARMVRGAAADASWRSHMMSRRKRDAGSEVAWSGADFVFAGVLLAATGILLELAVRKPRNIAYRAAAVATGVAAIVFVP